MSCNKQPRFVVGISGGSGVGQSTLAAILSYYLNQIGIGCYIISGDNYPHRIPTHNGAERLRIYRYHGVHGLMQTQIILMMPPGLVLI